MQTYTNINVKYAIVRYYGTYFRNFHKILIQHSMTNKIPYLDKKKKSKFTANLEILQEILKLYRKF